MLESDRGRTQDYAPVWNPGARLPSMAFCCRRFLLCLPLGSSPQSVVGLLNARIGEKGRGGGVERVKLKTRVGRGRGREREKGSSQITPTDKRTSQPYFLIT